MGQSIFQKEILRILNSELEKFGREGMLIEAMAKRIGIPMERLRLELRPLVNRHFIGITSTHLHLTEYGHDVIRGN